MPSEPGGVPDPRSSTITPVLVPQAAGQYEYLFASRTVHFELMCPGGQSFDGHPFPGIPVVMEEQLRCPCRVSLLPRCGHGVYDKADPFSRLHLAQFHQNDAARSRPRRMAAARRIADIGARGVVAMFIRKYAAEHQEFFTQAMFVRGKGAGRCVANERGSARDLASNTVEQAAVDAGLWRWNPGHLIGRDRHPLGEIGIDQFVRHSTSP